MMSHMTECLKIGILYQAKALLSSETVLFTVKADGTCDKVVMKNELITADVEISKVDATTGKELPGATLVIKDSKGNEKFYSYDEKGE